MGLFQGAGLEELNLTGNKLLSSGVTRVLQGFCCGKALKKLYLCDNDWTEEPELMEALHNCMVKNKVLTTYDLKHNNLTEIGVK